MIAIYTPYHSNRIKYVLDYIFKQQLGWEYTVFTSIDEVSEDYLVRINYSESPIKGWLHIQPSGLLNERGIRRFNTEFKIVNDLPVILANNGAIGFDLFGAVFYCLSRYEEYITKETDKHHRFSYKHSFLYQNNYLQTPLVDYWVKFFQTYLVNLFPAYLKLNAKVLPEVVVTIDIDSVFAFKGKGLKRQLGATIKDLVTLNWGQCIDRLNVIIGGAKDPFDNFDYQFEALKQHGIKANYFIQVGKYGEYDKNISANNSVFQTIIKRIVAEGHEVGLHPSYESYIYLEVIQKEKAILESIIKQPVTQSRQHFLRFSLPSTYIHLMTSGIKKEFSMGYSEVPGFRAATSLPFYWYDLEMERITDLEVHPFSMMDVAYKEFMKLSIDETLKFGKEIRKQITEVNGQFCFVYHNESLSNYRNWKGWRSVFENWLKA